MLMFLALAVAAATARPAPLLGPSDLDPALVLPAPPAPDSAQARAELAELRAIEAARSPADEAAARRDGDTKNASIFATVLGPRFDLAHLPATAALMTMVRVTEQDAVDRGKAYFQRRRPWMIAPDLATCERSNDPLSSYPSGHSTMAFSMAATLARLMPVDAQPLLARAAAYGQSRVVCEQHWRSDVTAGEALGLLVADRLMTKPAFRAAYASAAAELHAAHVGAGVSPAAAR